MQFSFKSGISCGTATAKIPLARTLAHMFFGDNSTDAIVLFRHYSFLSRQTILHIHISLKQVSPPVSIIKLSQLDVVLIVNANMT